MLLEADGCYIDLYDSVVIVVVGVHCSLKVADERLRFLVGVSFIIALVTLRFGFAKLLRSYEKQLCHSPEAQEEFVEFLPRLFPNVTEHSSFQSAFNTLVEEEVSLFNTHYLKRICDIFPEDIW